MLIHWKFRDSTELIGHLVAALPWFHKVTGKFLKVHGKVHACIGRYKVYKRSNCSDKGISNNMWTCTSPCKHRAAPICCAPLVKEGGLRGYRDAIFEITRISSMALLQNKSLFKVLRLDFLTQVLS